MLKLSRNNKPILTFSTAQELETYMSGLPRSSEGFWLRLAKVGAPMATVSKKDAIEAALCCGWIDGQLARFDEHSFLVLMTPRRPGSRWSAKNRDAAEQLAKQGRIRSAGFLEIEAAKADGRWDAAYASQGKAEIPEDLAAALSSNEAARQFFEVLDRANRFAIIYRVNDAKRPETRAKRIAHFMEMLARREAIHPLKSSKTAPPPER